MGVGEIVCVTRVAELAGDGLTRASSTRAEDTRAQRAVGVEMVPRAAALNEPLPGTRVETRSGQRIACMRANQAETGRNVN